MKYPLPALPIPSAAAARRPQYLRALPEHWFESSALLEGDAGPDMPVCSVSYLDAAAFAEWAGKHVPTEEEWEWAARGPEARAYPWGSDWTEGILWEFFPPTLVSITVPTDGLNTVGLYRRPDWYL